MATLGGDATLELLSGSTDGKPVAVAATSSPGTTIHTATATSGQRDVITLWACNVDTVSRTLTLQWGGTTTAEQIGPITLPPNCGDVLVVASKQLRNGLIVKAFADSANKVNLTGSVARYTDAS